MTKIRAVVLESFDSKEKDKDVLLFSLEKGKLWATLKGVKAEKAKLKVAKQTFCFADFFIETKGEKNFVTGIDLIESFEPISRDLNKYYESCGLCEIIKKSADYDMPEPTLFLMFVKALKNVCYLNCPFKYTITKFLLDIFKFSGYALDNEKCNNCHLPIASIRYIDFKVGDIVCPSCKTYYSKRLENEEFFILKMFTQTSYEKLSNIKVSQSSINSVLEILKTNYAERFDKTLNLLGV